MSRDSLKAGLIFRYASQTFISAIFVYSLIVIRTIQIYKGGIEGTCVPYGK